MKSLKYILVLLFALQGIMMSGAMAAGKMPGMSMEVGGESIQTGDDGNFQGNPIVNKETPNQSDKTPFQRDASCCAVECGCSSFLVQIKEIKKTTSNTLKARYNSFRLAEPPSFVLPDPPRTTFI